MTKKEFDLFLSEKEKSVAGETKINWTDRKKEWLSYLNALYSQIENCLKEFEQRGKIKIFKEPFEIIEENIGSYTADKMIIAFADEKIVLKPVGTNVIGAKGRVDMSGKYGSVKIVLVDSRMRGIRDQGQVASVDQDTFQKTKTDTMHSEPVQWEWRFVSAPPASIYQPVNEETIYSVIMELSNGYK